MPLQLPSNPPRAIDYTRAAANLESVDHFVNDEDPDTLDLPGGGTSPNLAQLREDAQTALDAQVAALTIEADEARDQAVAAAQASGLAQFYDTKALANAALAGLPADALIEVMADESVTGSPRTRYRKESGVYVFKLNLDLLRTQLADATEAAGTDPVDGSLDVTRFPNRILRRLRFKSRDYATFGDFGLVIGSVSNQAAALNNSFADCAAEGVQLRGLSAEFRASAKLIIPSGLNLWMPPDCGLVREWAAPSGMLDDSWFQVGSTSAGKANNVRIQGGYLRGVDHTADGNVFGGWGDDNKVDGLEVRTFSAGAGGGRAFIMVGDRWRFNGIQSKDPEDVAGTGGVRFMGGTDFMCQFAHIVSGDDCFQFVPSAGDGDPYRDLDIIRAFYANCVGHSTAAKLCIAAQIDPDDDGGLTCNINTVGFHNISGTATKRALIFSNEDSSGVLKNVRATHITVDCSGDVDGGNCLLIENVNNFLGDNITVLAPFRGARIDGGTDITLRKCNIAAPRNTSMDSGPPDLTGGKNALLAIGVDGLRIDGGVYEANNASVIELGTAAVETNNWTIDGATIKGIGDGFWGVNAVKGSGGLITGRTRFVRNGGATSAGGARFTSTATVMELESGDFRAVDVPVSATTADAVIFGNTPGYLLHRGDDDADIAIGDTYVDVPHGLARTPKRNEIAINPLTSNAKDWYGPTNITSTHFRINIPATLGAVATFSWDARIENS